jgi:hypothetical protein
MPCDRRLKRGQTIQQRANEIKKVVSTVSSGLVSGKIKPKIGPQGQITFTGLADNERDDVTDACMYRRLLATGSPMALAAIQRAEMLAGRSVDRTLVAQGAHSHDGGRTWHAHKG